LVPCLIDGDVAVWDSLAIVEHLHERFPGVWPSEPRQRAWARSAAAEMHSGFNALRAVCSMSCGARIRLHEISPRLRRDIDRVAALFADGLARHGGPFLGGASFSAVDAFYAPVAFRAQTYQLPLPEPAKAYLERLLALEPMAQWYRDALAEPWHDVAHDTETLEHGALIADLRAPAATARPSA
jgi:glutathione S-transferase